MSEYLSKKAVLEFIKARKAKFAGSYKDIEYGAYMELETIEAYIESGAFDADKKQLSDGYHTFEELYYHRMMLFAVICRLYKNRAWKSWKHHDGTMFDNSFIVGIETPQGHYTYHYNSLYWYVFDVKELERAPEWDGHQPEDVTRLISLPIDADIRPEVKWFAEQMEERLKANDHKGGWEDCSLGWLHGRLNEESEEVGKEIKAAWEREIDYGSIIKEAADVANFAMMIADIARRINAKEKVGTEEWRHKYFGAEWPKAEGDESDAN